MIIREIKIYGRLARWALALQHLNFTVQYKPGHTHQDADGLFRQAWDEKKEQDDKDVKLEDGGAVEG